jgi:hypothetical protein
VLEKTGTAPVAKEKDMVTSNDETMQRLFEESGLPWPELTPREQFAAYTTTAFRPASPLREAFWNLRSPLMQQYYLQQPAMTDVAKGDPYGSFSDYMRSVGTGTYAVPTASQWRTKAQDALAMARLTPGQFFEYYSPETRIEEEEATGYMSPEEWATYQATDEGYLATQIDAQTREQIAKLTPAQRLMYRQTYGTGGEAEENQLALASWLARQRTRGLGGMYGGQYGSAVQRAIGELQGQYQARNPGGNFLEWYLAKTGKEGGTGGLLT